MPRAWVTEKLYPDRKAELCSGQRQMPSKPCKKCQIQRVKHNSLEESVNWKMASVQKKAVKGLRTSTSNQLRWFLGGKKFFFFLPKFLSPWTQAKHPISKIFLTAYGIMHPNIFPSGSASVTKIPVIPTTQADAVLCPISTEMQYIHGTKSKVIINYEFLSLCCFIRTFS